MSQQKAKSLGLGYHRVHMGIFDFDVIFITGEYSAAVKYCEHLFEDDQIAEYDEAINGGYAPRGKCFMRDGYVPVVWVPGYPESSREYATLAHECIHAVRYLFHWVHLPFDDSTEEVHAHAVGHLVNSYLEKKPRIVKQ